MLVRSRSRTAIRNLAIGLMACASVFAAPIGSASATITPNQKRVCAYTSSNSVSGVQSFAMLVDRRVIDCAMVYTASPDWNGWDSPWFLHLSNPDQNWAQWVQNSPINDRRQLIINMPLIPMGVTSDDWRSIGASGGYEQYATILAQNLVGFGVGDAVIVLGAEANGSWENDYVGSTPQQMVEWVEFWRNTVHAMRQVPGAAFQFVWAVNNRFPATPFAQYYPGDDVVDMIGDDAYDIGVTADANDWNEVYNSAGGLASLIAFAQEHGKPIALPEWGVGLRDSATLAGNDDPAYVQGMGQVIAYNNLAFQTYFFAHEWQTELQQGPASLATYRYEFGDGGHAAGLNDGMDMVPAPNYRAQAPPTSSTGGAGTSGPTTVSGPALSDTTSTTPVKTTTTTTVLPPNTTPTAEPPTNTAAKKTSTATKNAKAETSTTAKKTTMAQKRSSEKKRGAVTARTPRHVHRGGRPSAPVFAARPSAAPRAGDRALLHM